MANPIQFLISKDGEKVIMASPNDNWKTIKFLGLNAEEWVWGSWETEDGLVFSEVGNYKEKVLEKYGDRGNFIDSLVFEKEFIDYAKEDGINLSNTSFRKLPEGLEVGRSLWLEGCTSLTKLPKGLKVRGHLFSKGCTSLIELPEGLKVGYDMVLKGCTSLDKIKGNLRSLSFLDFTGCISLMELPPKIKAKFYIDFSGCSSLTELSERTEIISSHIYVDKLPKGGKIRCSHIHIKNRD